MVFRKVGSTAGPAFLDLGFGFGYCLSDCCCEIHNRLDLVADELLPPFVFQICMQFSCPLPVLLLAATGLCTLFVGQAQLEQAGPAGEKLPQFCADIELVLLTSCPKSRGSSKASIDTRILCM